MHYHAAITYHHLTEDDAEVMLDCWVEVRPAWGPVLGYDPQRESGNVAVGFEADGMLPAMEYVRAACAAAKDRWEDQEGMWPEALHVVGITVGTGVAAELDSRLAGGR